MIGHQEIIKLEEDCTKRGKRDGLWYIAVNSVNLKVDKIAETYY